MITHPNPPKPDLLGKTELDVASTLINEANALLRMHGEDPRNDGTGDDLPVLTEVIFDLGESNTPLTSSAVPGIRNAAPQPAAPQAGLNPRVPEPRGAPSAAPPPAPQTRPPAMAARTLAPRAPEPRPPSTAIPPVRSPQPVPLPPGLAGRMPESRPFSSATVATVTPPAPQPQSVGVAARPSEPRPSSVATPPLSRPAFAGTAPHALPPKPHASPPQSVAPAQPGADKRIQTIVEELKLLDAFIVGEVETWMREELPMLVVREIAKLNERLRTEAIVHLRTTLLPRLSEHITEQIDKIVQDSKPGA
ncbi:MAG: hypothetical protein LBR95_00715 [Azoarcus sp.]|jgi:hypothetical protein|nr:hypothetical protein [Azoarcus sp.]